MTGLFSNQKLVLILSAMTGMLLPFAFAPFEFRFIAFVVPGLLFLVWWHLPRRAVFLSGLLFQLGFFAVGVHWVYYSIHLFGNAVAPLALLVTALFVVGLALICSLSGWLFASLRTDGILVSGLLFVAIWALMEWIRDWLFGGFPWLAVGYSQVDTWYGGFAPVFGVYGTGFLVVLVSVAGAVTLLRTDIRGRVSAAAMVVFVTLLAFWLNGIEWGQDRSEKLRIRMVQGNIAQQVKFERNTLAKTLNIYADLSSVRTERQPDVIIWPETAIPTGFARVENYLQPFVDSLNQQNSELLSGGFLRAERGVVYNAFRQLTGEKQTYLKHHLVPFGEFMPMRFVLDALASYIDIPMSDLSSGGADQPPLAIRGERFGISICYEDVFGNEMRRQLPGATVLVNVSNDTWFGDSAAPHQHQEIAAMRAREFARPLVRVTNTGISSFISARGEIQDSIAQFERGFLDRDLTPREGRTPYMLLGNYPVIAAFSVILLIVSGFGRRLRQR